MSSEYKKLRREINRFIEFIKHYDSALIGHSSTLDRLVKIEAASRPISSYEVSVILKNKDYIESIIKTMKSNVILMLYNLVESTVRVSMYDYYDRLSDKRLTFSQTIDSIQKLWIKNSLSKVKDNQLNVQVFNMIQNSIDSEYKIELDKDDFYLSGNADVRELKSILTKHGVDFDEKGFRDYGGTLSTIKNKRNSLAHGNVSFEDNGREFSVDQIIELKNNTYKCLDYFISLIDNEWC